MLDTSVVVAGLIARRGAASALVEAFFADRLHLAYKRCPQSRCQRRALILASIH